MDDFHQRVSSSRSIKPSAIPKDENDPNYQQTSPSLMNIKKPTTKNYRSTTISAASKAFGPKKKILAERNEASKSSLLETDFRKISILDNPDESLSHGNGDKDDVLVADLSPRPYDPLINYLSPRPQFLRYKPNRQRPRVIFRGDGETNDGLISRSGSFDSLKDSHDEADSDTNGSYVISSSSSSSSSSMSGERYLEQEEIVDKFKGTNSENDESDEDEIEEEEEDKCCNLKGVFKSLLLLGVLVLSTMFLFNGDMKHGYCMIQNHTLSHHRDQEIQMGPMEVVDKRTFERGDIVEAIWVKKHEWAVDSKYQVEIEGTDELKEVTFSESGETDAVEVAKDENKTKVEDFGEEVVEPQIRDVEEVSYQGLLEEQSGGATKLKIYQTVLLSRKHSGILMNPVEEVYNEKASDENVTESKTEEVGNSKDVTNEVVMSNKTVNDTKVNDEKASDEHVIKCKTEEVGNSKDVTDEVVMSNKTVNDTKVKDENLKPMVTSPVLVGLLVFPMVIGSLLAVFRSSAKPSSERWPIEEEIANIKDSSPLPSKAYSKTWIEENRISVLRSRGDEHIDDVVNSFGKNSPSSLHSTEKDRKEYSQSRTTRVELLSEFVVGENRRTSGVKNRTTEVEESNYSISSLGGKSHSVSTRAKPAHSVMDSPSQRAYTGKKKDGRDGEANVGGMKTPDNKETPHRGSSGTRTKKSKEEETNPIRRSSRIRELQNSRSNSSS